MTALEILEYLIAFLEIFQICCITISGLKQEKISQREKTGCAILSGVTGMLLFFAWKQGANVYIVMLVRTCILSVVLSFCNRISFGKTLLVFGCFHVLEELMRTWFVILLCIGPEGAKIAPVGRIALDISRVLLFLFAWKLQIWQKDHKAEVNWMLVFLLFLIGTAAMFSFQGVLAGNQDTMIIRSSLCVTLVFCGIFGMIYLIYIDMKKREEILKLQVDMAERQYEELAMEYEKNRLLYHDMNHHNLVIWKLAEQGEYERLHEYLGKLWPQSRTGHRQWTQNPVMDMVLEHKILAMEKKEIKCQICSDIIGEISILDRELCSLFANLLDNAMEACEKLEKEERNISVEIRRHHAMLMLIVENSCRQDAPVKKGIFRTTKKNRVLHGYGLRSVRQTVKNYGGQFESGMHGNNFYVKILIALVI